jgi:hypothetical protein
MDKKKVMISQPMRDKTKEEIVKDRNRAIEFLENEGYEVINTLFTDEWYSEDSMTKRGVVNKPLCLLTKDLENMSKCHACYFVKGWDNTNTRGCRIEYEVAKAYGIEAIFE